MMKIQNKLNKDLQSYRNQSEIFKIKSKFKIREFKN